MRATRLRRAMLGGLALLSALALAAPARADTVTDWDQIAAAALQSPGTATPPGAGQGAPSIAHLAMVHAAVYDAVNAIDGGHEPYVSSPAAEPWYSQDAAVATAARHVLVNGGLGIPAARLSAIDTAYQTALDAIPPGPAKAGGIATGEAAAAAMFATRVRGTAGSGPSALRSARCRASGGRSRRAQPPRSGRVAEGRHGRSCCATPTASAAGRRTGSRRARRAPSSPRSTRSDQRQARRVPPISPRRRSSGAPRTRPRRWPARCDRSRPPKAATLAENARMFASAYANSADALIVAWRDKARYSWWRPLAQPSAWPTRTATARPSPTSTGRRSSRPRRIPSTRPGSRRSGARSPGFAPGLLRHRPDFAYLRGPPWAA